MNGLTRKNDGICGKASEVERQSRDRVLEVCCEEKMTKLSRQEEQAMEGERAKKQRVQQENGEERVGGENREEVRERVRLADGALQKAATHFFLKTNSEK